MINQGAQDTGVFYSFWMLSDTAAAWHSIKKSVTAFASYNTTTNRNIKTFRM